MNEDFKHLLSFLRRYREDITTEDHKYLIFGEEGIVSEIDKAIIILSKGTAYLSPCTSKDNKGSKIVFFDEL